MPEEDFCLDSIFPEPPRPPTPEPTIVVYDLETSSGRKEIEIQLVGSHPLWGHHLWNASRAFATYLTSHPTLYRDKNVLELGAGGGLPGIVVGLGGGRKVVITDYPDKDLVENLEGNVRRNFPGGEGRRRVNVQGYIWGGPVEPLLRILHSSDEDTDGRGSKTGFDLIIMSDLIFNHSQHDALLKTCDLALAHSAPPSSSPPPSVLVFYTHHRPHLAHRDMQFFEKAREEGWACEEVVTQKFQPMFPDDPGEVEVRSTVHGWRMTKL